MEDIEKQARALVCSLSPKEGPEKRLSRLHFYLRAVYGVDKKAEEVVWRAIELVRNGV